CLDDLEHLALAREKDDIDWEAHEESVHRPGRPEQQPLPALQPATSEQPPHPRPRRVGDRAPLARHLTLRRPQGNDPHHQFFAPSVKSTATRRSFSNVIRWIAPG